MIVTPIATAPGLYRCTSSTREGVTYTVDAVERRCDCQAGQHGRPCRHVAEVHRQNAEAAIAEARRRAVVEDYDRSGIGRCRSGLSCCHGDHALVRDDDGVTYCVPCFLYLRRVQMCRVAGCPSPALADYAECSVHIFGEA